MLDRLAIILVGAQNSGKTSTLKEYSDHYYGPVATFKKGWRHGLSPFKPKFLTVKVSAYVLPSSPTETRIPLSITLDALDWWPDIILMAEQDGGSEYINTINELRGKDYHIKTFGLTSTVGVETWVRWELKGDEAERLKYRREDIADYIRNFINSRT